MDKMPLLLHVFYEPSGLIKCSKLLTALRFFKMPKKFLRKCKVIDSVRIKN